MSALILFSGGVESTALLVDAKPGDTLLSITPTFPGDTPSYRQKSAEKIAAYFGHNTVFAGANLPVEPEPYRFVHQMRVFVSLANLWCAKDKTITEVWCGRNASEPAAELSGFIDQMMAGWHVLQPSVPFLHPLDHLSKREQWQRIPDAVKPLVSSCIYHRMCGTCSKCLEWTCLSETLPSATN